jgi:hypothetical protein
LDSDFGKTYITAVGEYAFQNYKNLGKGDANVHCEPKKTVSQMCTVTNYDDGYNKAAVAFPSGYLILGSYAFSAFGRTVTRYNYRTGVTDTLSYTPLGLTFTPLSFCVYSGDIVYGLVNVGSGLAHIVRFNFADGTRTFRAFVGSYNNPTMYISPDGDRILVAGESGFRMVHFVYTISTNALSTGHTETTFFIELLTADFYNGNFVVTTMDHSSGDIICYFIVPSTNLVTSTLTSSSILTPGTSRALTSTQDTFSNALFMSFYGDSSHLSVIYKIDFDTMTISRVMPHYSGTRRSLIVPSRKKLFYIELNSGNTAYDVYDYLTNTFLDSMPYGSSTNNSIFCNADDVDDGILIYTGSSVVKYTFNPTKVKTVISTASFDSTELDSPFFYLLGELLCAEKSIYYPMSSDEPSGHMLLKVENSTLTLIDALPMGLKVDMSKGFPLVLYGGMPFYNTGKIYISETDNRANIRDLMLYVDGFSVLSGYITDVRSFDWPLTSGNKRLTAYAQNKVNGDFYVTDPSRDYFTTPQSWFIPPSGEGPVTHMEATNYHSVPYLFITTSGVNFYQSDGEDLWEGGSLTPFFTQRNTNLPSSKATIIRCDDLL